MERLYSDGQGPVSGCGALEEDGIRVDDEDHHF
jgi:hypothetical protein